MSENMVNILLSTKNGGDFLREFLTSLDNQSFRDFSVLARDDGSSDDSENQLKAHPSVTMHPSSSDPLGVVNSYGILLKDAPDGYTMLADQDDIWHPGKIKCAVEEIRAAEAVFGKDTPILMHSDLFICDSAGKRISDSLMHYQHLDPDNASLSNLLIQNNITGCSIIFNQALHKKIRYPFPADIICHDWLIALLASVSGKIIFMKNKSIDYRKHDHNVFGPQEYSIKHAFCMWLSEKEQMKQKLIMTQKQALGFFNTYGDMLSAADRELIFAWGNMSGSSKLAKIMSCIKHRFRKNTFMRTLGMWWII